MTPLVVESDNSCDVENNKQEESCCDGAVCDCTCCIHISLFNTSFGELSFQGEAEKEIYNYVDTYGFNIPFPIFHPPVLLG